ncbi:MAG: Rrf2 family transcriptional regulator [Lachnospiraceae bacterium]|nr:Rrf2 family transcriptional regulator [Lachnospiraceae bacterium]
MKTNSRLSIAVQAMILIYMAQDDMKVTGDSIAKSEMVNPVIVRGVISSLKKAGIISVAAGKGGAHALKEPSDVTLWDIYAAVNTEEDRQLFGFHGCSKSRCPVAKNMHKVLDRRLLNAEKAVQNSFSGVTMADVMQDMQVGCGVTKEVLLKALNG